MANNTTQFTDANGTSFIVDKATRKIVTSMCRSGFIYDSKGERTGNIHGYTFAEGCYY